jgi:hypothetical protein
MDCTSKNGLRAQIRLFVGVRRPFWAVLRASALWHPKVPLDGVRLANGWRLGGSARERTESTLAGLNFGENGGSNGGQVPICRPETFVSGRHSNGAQKPDVYTSPPPPETEGKWGTPLGPGGWMWPNVGFLWLGVGFVPA